MSEKSRIGIHIYVIAVLVPTLFMVVVLTTLVKQSNAKIAFTALELEGVHEVRSFYDLQLLTQELRGLGQFKHIYKGELGEVEVRRDYIYTELLELIDVLQSSEQTKIFSDHEVLNTLKQDVIALEGDSHLASRLSYEQYSDRLNDLLEFMVEVGNYSNLTLDSQLSTHYRIDAVVERIPMLTEHISQLQSTPIWALSDFSDVSELVMLLRYRIEQLQLEMLRLSNAYGGLAQEGDATDYGHQLLSMLNEKLAGFSVSIEALSLSELSVSAAILWYEDANVLFEVVDELYKYNSDYLQDLLQRRIAQQIKQRNTLVAVIVLAILAMLLGMGWFYRKNSAAFQQLADSQYFLKRVLDTIPVRVFWKDLDSAYLGCNELFARDAGREASVEIIGKSDYELCWAENAEAYRADDQAVMSGGEVKLRYEEPQMQVDGSVLWLQTSKIPLEDESGHVIGVLGVYEDITERKEAEKNLLYSEKRLRSIVDNMVDALITIDEHGLIQSYNRAAELMFDYSEEEVVNQNISMLMPEPYHGEHDGYLARYIQSGEMDVMGTLREAVAKRKSGEVFPVELAISEIDLNGRRLFSGIVRDVTERKRNEKLKNEFVSTVSHELRTPLTSIRGSLGVLSAGVAGELPEVAQKMLTIASNNTERLLLLINDILDIQKIEADQMTIELESLDIKALLVKVIEENNAYAAQYGSSFMLQDIAEGVKVMADPGRLAQVISNLLSNAVKFSPSGEVVEIAVNDLSEDRVRISVADHGAGIPVLFQGKLFDKFTQCDSSDSREKGGTGLGMSIVKALTENMGGEISFTTQEGEGSTFYVDLQRG